MHNNTNRQGYRRGRPDWFLCPVRSPASLNPPSLHKPSFTALFQPPRSNHTCAPPTHRTNTTQQTHSKNNRQGHGCCRHRLVPVPSAHPGPRGALRGLIPSGKQVGLKNKSVCSLCALVHMCWSAVHGILDHGGPFVASFPVETGETKKQECVLFSVCVGWK